MKKSSSMKILSVAIATTLIGGCVSTPEQQDQMGGAVAGCVGGALIGAMLGDRNAAIAGCAAGALAGWGAVKISQYQAKQTRSRAEDEALYRSSDPEFYGLAKTSNQSAARIRSAVSAPERIKGGSTITNNMSYSVATPKGTDNVSVTEVYRLKKDGKTLFTDTQSRVRGSGSWSITSDIPIPSNAESGTYVVEHEVTAGTSKDVQRSFFIVG
uniref:Glycine zipper n=1 Tax=Candidatus Kentrum sp. LFY TaxID=2126342 RepID=A0A450U643_9GAMM|nr:MAG: hypothetical protein BECKLFY1418B_GA0070995_100528 [Candidatus Kentron sp. LFY]